MGIIKTIKKFFSSDICPDKSKLTGIVTPYKLKHGEIKTDCKVVVPSGYAFVLGHNGKALDAFREGEYFMSPAVLPECCKKLKIHKLDKKGEVKKKFKADLYFVSLSPCDFSFKTGQCVEMGNRAMGIFSAGAEGRVKITVKDPKELLEALLEEFAYLRDGEGEKIIQTWLVDCVINCFQKNNFALSEFVSNNDIIISKTKSDMMMFLSKRGITLEEFEITNFNLPKKYRKEYEANKKKKEEKTDTSCEIETIEQKLEEKEEVAVKEKETADEYVPFGNISFEAQNSQEEQDETHEAEQIEPKESDNQPNDEIQLEPEIDELANTDTRAEGENDSAFVDLDIDKIISDDIAGKRCLNCGAINAEDDDRCSVCGKKL